MSEASDRQRRELATDDRGSGMVAGVTFMFAFTFLALVWLARDVDRGISNQSAATSIAFQAARSGAQAALIEDVRDGDVVALDAARARSAAADTATKLFTSYRVRGRVTAIDVDLATSKVIVTVSIVDGSTTVTGVGAAEAVEVS